MVLPKPIEAASGLAGTSWARKPPAKRPRLDQPQRYRVIAPDQIGFCKSTKPARYQYSFQQLALNTHALLSSLEIHNAALIVSKDSSDAFSGSKMPSSGVRGDFDLIGQNWKWEVFGQYMYNRTNTSNINFRPGIDVANTTIAQLGTNGSVSCSSPISHSPPRPGMRR